MNSRLPIIDALLVEHRGNRPYDEQDASHIRHPNGSLVDSYDRDFCGVAMREVLALYVGAAA